MYKATQIFWSIKSLQEVGTSSETKMRKNLLPFVTQYNPSVPNLKNILMSKWHLIENHPLLKEIYQDPRIISYKRQKYLKDILERAKL